MLFFSAGALLMTTESAAAAGDDNDVASKAVASEGVMLMTVRVTIVRRYQQRISLAPQSIIATML